MNRLWTIALVVGPVWSAHAEDTALRDALETSIIADDLPWQEVRQFCSTRVRPTPEPTSVDEWERYAETLRADVLSEVVFRGEAAQWSELPTRAEWLETIEGGPEYRIRKLRYEAVPGMWIPALLYEPKNLTGRVPVVLNVNGHDGNGKVAEYKQARCINQAKRGMLALNVEWLGMGQLRGDDFVHYRMNQMDLCGTSGLAPFYLSMSRGLDILLEHEHADPDRVAVAGLSGGGWQTIFISSLDTRVTLSNPVAGYSSFITRSGVTSDLGDSEQTPCDLATVADYAQLTAIRAPRPTLLTFNDRDNCCFAAGHALPPLLDAARPIYRLYGKSENLVSHVNHKPGNHNFDRDNREALYRMFGEFFYPDDDFAWREIDYAGELKTREELDVPLPDDHGGFNTLAKKLAADLPVASDDAPAARRAQLAEIVRAHHPAVTSAEVTSAVAGKQWDATHWSLRVGDTWTVPAVEIAPKQIAGTTIVIADGGRTAALERIESLVAAGQRVVAVDPFYFGESKISQKDFLYGLLVAAVGERPLGIQADQLTAIASWLKNDRETGPVTIAAQGRRTGLIALVAAALEKEGITGIQTDGEFNSLHEIINENLQIPDGPEMFCFGLLKEFDIPQLKAMVGPRE